MFKQLLLAGAALALVTGSAAAKDLNSIGITLGSLGNPFFVAQLVHYLATTYAQAANDGGNAGEAAALPRGNEPITLERVLRERLSHLPEPALALLEVLAVAGRPIACDLALEASGVGAEADNALSLLRAGAWLRSQGPRKDDAVECYHDRVREVVAQALPAARLRARHARIAVTLELGSTPSTCTIPAFTMIGPVCVLALLESTRLPDPIFVSGLNPESGPAHSAVMPVPTFTVAFPSCPGLGPIPRMISLLITELSSGMICGCVPADEFQTLIGPD